MYCAILSLSSRHSCSFFTATLHTSCRVLSSADHGITCEFSLEIPSTSLAPSEHSPPPRTLHLDSRPISQAMSWSTLRVGSQAKPPRSLTSLSNDNLLAILEHLSVPQLLTLLSASRRLNALIRQFTLPAYHSLSLPDLSATFILFKSALFFSRRLRVHTEFYQTLTLEKQYLMAGDRLFRGRPSFRSLLASFPAHLPDLLPHLGSLTYAYFLHESSPKLSEEKGRINRLLTGYLQSSWCTTLVSLELHLVVGPASAALGEPLFAQLNQLTQLRHLFLHCCPQLSFIDANGNYIHRLLPDSLPVLGRLLSFTLHRYIAANTATLLAQLGPNLSCLGLFCVNLSGEEFLDFLSSKPTYRGTLRSLEIQLRENEPTFWSQALRHCLSLERLYCPLNYGDLFSFLGDLSRLSHLRELGHLPLSISELRALRDTYPCFSLPRLTNLRRVSLRLSCCLHGTDWEAFQAAELFDHHVPALGAIFGAVEHIEIQFTSHPGPTELSASLSEQLVASMVRHFPTARTCKGKYWKRVSK